RTAYRAPSVPGSCRNGAVTSVHPYASQGLCCSSLASEDSVDVGGPGDEFFGGFRRVTDQWTREHRQGDGEGDQAHGGADHALGQDDGGDHGGGGGRVTQARGRADGL